MKENKKNLRIDKPGNGIISWYIIRDEHHQTYQLTSKNIAYINLDFYKFQGY